MPAAFFPISVSAVTLGAASVGVLYVLHHLRVQPQPKRTATLLFWQQSVGTQRTRVPWSRRFSNPKTFALLAAILLLLAATLTADRWSHSSEQRRDVIVIDAGAMTGVPDASGVTLLNRLANAAKIDLHRLPVGAAVVSAGPRPVLLAAIDTPAVLAAHQMDILTPQPGASASRLAILLASGVIGDRPGNIHWYTAQTQVPSGLPDEVARRVVVHATAAPDAVAIAGVTFEPAADDASRGTLHVRLAGTPLHQGHDFGRRL